MKKVVCIASLVLLMAGFAEAGPYGPIRSAAKPGQISQEVGVFLSQAKWDAEKSGFTEGTVTQNQAYVQAGYGIDADSEAYFRVGGSDLDFESDLEGIGLFANQEIEMDGGVHPFVTVGARSVLHHGSLFDFGVFAQGSYFFSMDDERSYEKQGFTVREEVELTDIWDVSAGAALQTDLLGASLYFGPVLYYGRANVDTTTEVNGNTDANSARYEEKGNLGAVLGLTIPVADYGSLRLEGQYKSSVSGGGALVYLRLNR